MANSPMVYRSPYYGRRSPVAGASLYIRANTVSYSFAIRMTMLE